MRLLCTSKLELRDFIADIPAYAILSHTWGSGEVLFHDIQNHTATSKAGYPKLEGSCKKARQDGFEWIWVDTCCIDKSSSAELTESINSMYQYYEASAICYAYLADVKYLDDVKVASLGGIDGLKTQVRRSRWFTRGWTLQELIAPKTVVFYTVDWDEIGTKGSFPNLLSSITDIPTRVLLGDAPSSCSIAERMSWASHRQTTRLEDAAYSLLGLFNVNMPMLYGEGGKAFSRLQENILKQEEDYTILAWTLQRDCRNRLTGFLATSPSEFSNQVPQELQQPTISEYTFEDLQDFKKKALSELVPPSSPDPKDMKESPEENSEPPGIEEVYEEWKRQRRIKEGRIRDRFAEQFLGLRDEKAQQVSALNVLLDKRYGDMRHYRPQNQAIDTLAPKSPPHISSRGLHLTLPVARLWETNEKNPPMLAWLYTEYQDRLLCILLQKLRHVIGRVSSPRLISVERSFMERFVATELVVLPSGEFSQESGASISRTLRPAPRWGRIKVDVVDDVGLDTQLASVWPPKLWNMDELIFNYQQGAVGVLLFEVAQTARRTYKVMVAVGFVNQRHWCHAESILDHQQQRHSNSLDALEAYYEKLHGDKWNTTDIPKVDRSAVELPGLVMSFALRETASPVGYATAFILRVALSATGFQDIWASLQMLEEADSSA